jgi:ADP-heptose:LPS heptosyltransferase
MKIITFSKRVSVSTTYGPQQTQISVNPGERLIFDDDNAMSIQTNPGSNAFIYEITDLNPLLKELPTPATWKRRRLLFYRNRGIGDQLICSALSRYAREILGAEAYQLCDKVHESVWAGNPYIGAAPLAVPLHIDAVWRSKGRPFFDRSFFIESASEWDSDSEQPNIYDRLFAMMGVEAERVPAKYKRPVFMLHAEDTIRRIEWLKELGASSNRNLAKGYIFAQLRTTNAVRSFPPKLVEIILAAANEFAGPREISIICADDKPFPPSIQTLIDATPTAIDVSGRIPGVRMFGNIIAGSNLVIGPDSAALHFAAAVEVPALGIWGPFSPESRTAYYPNQIHLFHRELCQNAPCFNFLPELPTHKCPRGAQQTSCEVYAGVTYQEIFDAIQKLF